MAKEYNHARPPFSNLDYNGFGKKVFDEMIASFAYLDRKGKRQLRQLRAQKKRRGSKKNLNQESGLDI